MTVAIPRAIRDGRRAGAAMLLALALGMIAANSSLSDGYAFLHHNPLRLGLAELQIEAPLIDWINQGLLTVFFFRSASIPTKRSPQVFSRRRVRLRFLLPQHLAV